MVRNLVCAGIIAVQFFPNFHVQNHIPFKLGAQ
jgi:hypothetical protein